MFPVTITLHNPTQLNAVLAAMGGDIEQVAAASHATAPATNMTADEAAKATKTETQKAKTETQKAKADPKPEAATASEPTPDTSTSSANSSTESTQADEPVTYQDAAAAVTKLSRAKGRDAAVAVLEKFKAAKLPDVKPEQFADVIAACEEAMA